MNDNKNILVFIYDGMADFEMTLAYHRVGSERHFKIITIAYKKDFVQSAVGVKYQPELTVTEALNMQQVEGLIIPGGAIVEQKPELNKLINKLNDEHKLLAAICIGPQYLAKSGVLRHKQFTTSVNEESFKNDFGEEDPFDRCFYLEKRVVRDGNITTAKGIAFVDFAIEICDYLGIVKTQLEKQEMLDLYKS